MTNQEIFDIVATHLLKQGVRSEFPGTDSNSLMSCAYRGADGRKCAIGILIPDELYKPEMEGKHAGFVIAQFPEVRNLLQPESEWILRNLQAIHDQADPKDWRHHLHILAIDNGLSTKVLDS